MLSVVNYKDAALEKNHEEVTNVSDKKETVQKALNEMETELENFKLMKLEQSKSHFECEHCDVKVEHYDLHYELHIHSVH